jgi:two-component system phosphate regulon response regulator PhoB
MPREEPLVVVANDDRAIIDMLTTLLAEEGYETVAAFSGTDAFQVIKEQQPDLVIIDMQMEQRDTGLRVLELMRLSPETKTIPAIICSADGRFLHEKALHLRAHHCEILEKPFNLVELLAKVRKFIKRRGQLEAGT